MSSTPEQVRVRLTAEGVQEVVNALKTVQAEARKTGGPSGIGSINQALGDFKRLLPAIGVGAIVAGFVGLTKAALANADALGKLSEKVGATVEELSALQVAARLDDVSLESLQAGLSKTAVNVGKLKAGIPEAVASFRQLGLVARDFDGKDTAQAFELISQRIAAIEDPARKAQVATEILGKGFADLIPLVNDLAENGLDNLIKQAQDLGLLITGDLTAAADAANDSFTIIKMQAEGLATAFASGLAPSIVAAMGDFSKSIEGDGVKEMQRFGAEAGRVLRTVIAVFRLFATVASNIFQGVGVTIGGVFAAISAGLKGNFREAWNILGDITEQNKLLDQKAAVNVKAALDEVIKQATTDAAPIVLKTKIDNSALQEQMREAIAAADAARAKGAGSGEQARLDAEARRLAAAAAAEAKRAAEEQLRLAKERFGFEQRILELEGNGKQAALNELDQEIARYREILRLQGLSTEQIDKQAAHFKALATAQIEVQDAAAKAAEQFDAIDQARTQLEQDVQLGRVSEADAQRKLLEIEKERLAIALQFVDTSLAAAQASGNPALIAQAEALKTKYEELLVVYKQNADGLAEIKVAARDALESGVATFLSDIRTGSKSVSEAFKDMAKNLLNSIASVIESRLAKQFTDWLLGAAGSSGGSVGGGFLGAAASFFGSMFGGGAKLGGVVKAAEGGLLQGPGTGTSDSILARVSNKEFIVRAKSAGEQPGALPFLNAFNEGRIRVADIQSGLSLAGLRMPRFAMGGPVSVSGTPANAKIPGGVTINQTVVTQNGQVNRQTLGQVATATRRGMDEAARRNG